MLSRSDLKACYRAERQGHIDRFFRDQLDWLDNTQHTDDELCHQVAAMLIGQSAKERP